METFIINVSFGEFFIFTKMGSQKGATTLIFGFFDFAWAGHCVGGSNISQMKDCAHFDINMGSQNGV